MARPKAKVLLNQQTDSSPQFEVLAASAMYVVVYKNQPINVKKRYWTVRGETNKYHKVAFPSPAPARNLADKLNKSFNCEDFSVMKIF